MADVMQGAARILLVEDDPALRETLAELLSRRGYRPVLAGTAREALERLGPELASVVLDLRLPDRDGMEVLAEMRRRDPTLPVIVVTGYGSERRAVKSLRLGAFTYIPKPVDPEELLGHLREAVEKWALRREVERLRADLDERYGLEGLLGNSAPMRQVFAKIRQVAQARSTVLITGESGTGKELVARAIHQLSDRRDRPFVAINCAALPESLVEDELFGHVRGAFTGADRDREGRFKQAHGGTLFIDEIAEMPLPIQAKLLRVLETLEFSPVGSTEVERVDVRVLAATNRDLRALVEAGRFREDLFYRIHVVTIELPPLRERPGDVALLARAFLDELAALNRRPARELSPEALRALERYSWPGNVRELRNVLERLVVLSTKPVIELADLPPEIRGGGEEVPPAGGGLRLRPGTPLRDAERALILATLAEFQGNRVRTAEALGISLRTLQRKLKEYGLTRRRPAGRPSPAGGGRPSAG